MDKRGLGTWAGIALVLNIGFSLAMPIVGGILLGVYLDRRCGTGFLFLIVMCIVGATGGFWSTYRVLERWTSRDK